MHLQPLVLTEQVTACLSRRRQPLSVFPWMGPGLAPVLGEGRARRANIQVGSQAQAWGKRGEQTLDCAQWQDFLKCAPHISVTGHPELTGQGGLRVTRKRLGGVPTCCQGGQ